MFVSSYSTYIRTNNTDRISKDRELQEKKPSESFASKLSQSNVIESRNSLNFPINYISNYKALGNKQKLQENLTKDLQNQNIQKFSKQSAQIGAKEAYNSNSRMFSFLIKPSFTLDQTPKIDKKLSQDIKNIKETNMRNTMVNTYLANDKYYQITA